MKKTIKLNLWDLIDIDDINYILDNELKNGFATYISYQIKKCSKDGVLIIEANFIKENI